MSQKDTQRSRQRRNTQHGQGSHLVDTLTQARRGNSLQQPVTPLMDAGRSCVIPQ